MLAQSAGLQSAGLQSAELLAPAAAGLALLEQQLFAASPAAAGLA